MIRHMLAAGMQSIDDTTSIDRIPVDDGGDNQVEGRCPNREIFLAAMAEAAEAMEIDGPHQAVAVFPFIQLCRCWTSPPKVEGKSSSLGLAENYSSTSSAGSTSKPRSSSPQT